MELRDDLGTLMYFIVKVHLIGLFLARLFGGGGGGGGGVGCCPMW